jgi:hypothetical protein
MSSSSSLNSGLGASDRDGVGWGVESECDGKFLDWFLSPDMLRLYFTFFAFHPPGMLQAEVRIPFLVVALYSKYLNFIT